MRSDSRQLFFNSYDADVCCYGARKLFRASIVVVPQALNGCNELLNSRRTPARIVAAIATAHGASAVNITTAVAAHRAQRAPQALRMSPVQWCTGYKRALVPGMPVPHIQALDTLLPVAALAFDKAIGNSNSQDCSA